MIRTVFLLVCLLIASVPGQAMDQKHVLDNGMTVILNEMPNSPTVSIFLLVKTGSATEGRYLGTGISHFVEHMLFKGTKKRSVGTIPAEVKALGGKINASTGFDFTIYTLDVPYSAMNQGIDIIFDMVMNSIFDPEEVKKEQNVIFSEMRMINDRPDRKLGDLLFQNVFIKHPYKHPIIGYIPLFGQITQKQLVRYYKTHYIPNNMVLSVAGQFQSDQVLPMIEQAVKDFKPQPYTLRNLPQEPDQFSPRRMEIGYASKTTRIALAFQGVSTFDEDMVALDVLAGILGQGKSSRLYTDLFKTRKLVDNVSASNYTPADKGVFEVSAEFEQGDVDEIVQAIKHNIKRIKEKGVDPAELDKSVHQISSSLVFGRQTSSSVAYNTAVNEAIMGDYEYDQKYLSLAKKLKVEDIQRVAKKYLDESRSTLVVLKPDNEVRSLKATAQNIVDSAILKEVLPSELTVLLKEDHTLPIASIMVTMRAGSREEPEELSGLNQLTADLWIKAAGAINSDQMAEMIEAKGASLSSSGGYNSISLRMDFLSDDLDFALNVIEAIIKKPSFDLNDFENQKKSGLANVKEQDDSVLQTAFREMRANLFKNHPLRLEISGTIPGLQRTTRQHVVDFYQKFYTAKHMVIGVYGDIKQDAVLTQIKKRFAQIPNRSVDLSVFHEDLPSDIREKIVPMDKEQAAVVLGVMAPDLYDPDRTGMEVISSILGSSLNGRLFVKIREDLGKAYTLGCVYLPNLDTGLMMFYVLTTDDQVKRVREIMSAELKNLMAMPVGKDELNAAKSSLMAQFAMESHTVSGLVAMTAFDELYGLGVENYKNYNAKVDSVSSDDLMRIAEKYLDPQRGSWVIVESNKK